MYPTFSEASIAKAQELVEHPDNNYQIRRRKEGGRKTSATPPHDNFDLMQRVTSSEAKQVIHRAEKLKKGKKYVHNHES